MSAQTALQRNSASQPGRPDDIADLSALDLIQRYRTKSLSSVEATQAVLARIERLDRHVNAFALLDAESALASARESEARWQRGEPLGPVDGVPVCGLGSREHTSSSPESRFHLETATKLLKLLERISPSFSKCAL